MAEPAMTAPAPAAKPSAVPPKKKDRGNLLPRLSVPLTADKSRFAVDQMTEPIRDRLRALVADPELRLRLALPDDRPVVDAAAAAPALPDKWDTEFAAMLYDLIGKAAIGLAQRRGYTASEAAVLTFTEGDKAFLGPPTVAVLDEMFPGGLARYGAKVMLAGALLVVGQRKIAALQEAAAPRLAAAAAAVGPTGATVHPFPIPAAPGSTAAGE